MCINDKKIKNTSILNLEDGFNSNLGQKFVIAKVCTSTRSIIFFFYVNQKQINV